MRPRIFTDQFSDLHTEFLKERSAQNVYITGLEKCLGMFLKPFWGSILEAILRLFARWRDSYTTWYFK